MNVTIIPSDGVVVVDGRVFNEIDLSFLPADAHAIHWRGTVGEVEVKDSSGRIIENRMITDFSAYQLALDAWEEKRQIADTPLPPPPPLTQFELDQLRYKKRAAVQSELIAWMAADNMSRVRSGVWTVADLTSLMSDPAVVAANAYMQTLSYELAAQSIASATTPLLTQAIKDVWISKLTEHFYLVP